MDELHAEVEELERLTLESAQHATEAVWLRTRAVYETDLREAKADAERCGETIASTKKWIELYESCLIEAQVRDTETHIHLCRPHL